MKAKINVNSYLIFKIEDERFAALADNIVNILGYQHITKVPKAPIYMKGVINLRGTVLPVIDTRIKFDMNPTEFTDKTCIVVLDLKVNGEIIHIGALVDSVDSVYKIAKNNIEETPNIGTGYRSEFITGIATVDKDFVMILDLVKLFTMDEITCLKKSNKKQITN